MKKLLLLLLLASSAWSLPLTKFDSLMLMQPRHAAIGSDSILILRGDTIKFRSKAEMASDLGVTPITPPHGLGVADSAHFADSCWISDSARVADTVKKTDNRYLLLHGKADSAIKADTSLKTDNRYAPAAHGVTVGTVPKAATAKTWGNSTLIQATSGGVECVGINANPEAQLQINSPTSGEAIGSIPILRVLGSHQSQTPQTMLRLGRTNYSYYSASADFNLYASGPAGGGNPQTQLDFALKFSPNNTETADVTVLTLKAQDVVQGNNQASVTVPGALIVNGASIFTLGLFGPVGINISAAAESPLQIGTPTAGESVGSLPVLRVLGTNLSQTPQTMLRLGRKNYNYYSGSVDFNVYAYGPAAPGYDPKTTLDINLKSLANVVETADVTVIRLKADGTVTIPSLTAGGIVKAAAGTGLLSAAALTAAECAAAVSGTTNYLAKFTGANTVGNSLIYDNGTNVGINTATPYSGTGVNSLTINAAAYPVLNLQLSGTTNIMQITGYTDHIAMWTNGSRYLSLGSNDAEQVRITTAGLRVLGSEPTIYLQDTRTDDPTTWSFNSEYSGAPGNATRFCFFNGSNRLLTILKTGSVGIGTPRPNAKLTVNGNFNDTGTVYISTLGTGSVTCASGVLAYACDERQKNIKGNFTKGLDVILKVTPKTWTYNKKSGFDTTETIASVTAQDLQKAGLSEATHLSKSGMYGVDDRTLIAALINAVKELKQQNEELKIRISKIEENEILPGPSQKLKWEEK